MGLKIKIEIRMLCFIYLWSNVIIALYTMSCVDEELKLVACISEETGNEVLTFLCFYTKYCTNAPSISDILYNVITSFLTNEFEKDGVKLFVNQIKDFSNIFETQTTDEVNIKHAIDFQNMMNGWAMHLENSLSNTTSYDIFIKIIKELNDLDKSDEKIFKFIKNFYKVLCNIKQFRNVFITIDDDNIYENGNLYETLGFFSPLFFRRHKRFASSVLNNYGSANSNELLQYIEPLLVDVNLHESIVSYIYNILQVNTQYTRDNISTIDMKNTSSMSFNNFMLIILINLFQRRTMDCIKNNILDSDTSYIVKEYDLSLLGYSHKLYVTLALAIPICYTSAFKFYYSHEYELSSLSMMSVFGLGTNNEKLKLIKSKMEALKLFFSDYQTNQFVQSFYTNYFELNDKFVIVELYDDFITFVDYITFFKQTDEVVFNIDKKTNTLVSRIMGGKFQHANSHVRHYASHTLFKIISIDGYSNIPSVFNDLFGYICDVDYYKWLRYDSAMQHHRRVLQNMLMLLDYPEKIFEQSDSIISKTLFTLLSHAIDSYETFIEICNKIKLSSINQDVELLFQDLIEIIVWTLNIYSTIYTNAVIKTTYAETEEKYSILVNRIISSVMIKDNVFNTKLKRPQYATDLMIPTYKSLCDHIDLSAKHLYKNKVTIVEGLDYSGLNVTQKELIIQKFNEIENSSEINIDFPDEFLDPLICSVIENPIKIPGVSEIHDRISIVSHIHDSEENPYNREKLTIEMLDEYNKLPDVVSEILAFNEKKKKFIEDNKK